MTIQVASALNDESEPMQSQTGTTAPLSGIRVLEMGGIGPGPFAGMMLADMGADVVRVDRLSSVDTKPERVSRADVLNRGRRSIAVDLKTDEGREIVLDLVANADVLLEGYRPLVMERLGLGPASCHARNRRLVYARMTGWGQDGPYAGMAGHDINYIAVAGALAHIGRAGEKPTVPLNLVGDFGGGGMMMAFGIVCGLLEARSSGEGQVIDAAMIDGASLMMTMFWGLKAQGQLAEQRGTNLLDSGAPYYDTYECSDGKFVAVGAIEPQFFAELCALLDLDVADLPRPQQRSNWPVLRERITAAFARQPRDAWAEKALGTDACVTPVLTLEEAALNDHNRFRGYSHYVAGIEQPLAAPRFVGTAVGATAPPPMPGEHHSEVLSHWGTSDGAQ